MPSALPKQSIQKRFSSQSPVIRRMMVRSVARMWTKGPTILGLFKDSIPIAHRPPGTVLESHFRKCSRICHAKPLVQPDAGIVGERDARNHRVETRVLRAWETTVRRVRHRCRSLGDRGPRKHQSRLSNGILPDPSKRPLGRNPQPSPIRSSPPKGIVRLRFGKRLLSRLEGQARCRSARTTRRSSGSRSG